MADSFDGIEYLTQDNAWGDRLVSFGWGDLIGSHAVANSVDSETLIEEIGKWLTDRKAEL